MQRTIVHFGPDQRDPGGMARVVQSYLEADLEPWRVEAVSTYTSASRLRQVGHLARAVSILASRPRRSFHGIHVHASERFDLVRTSLLLEVASRRGLPAVVTLHGANFMADVERRPTRVRAMLRRARAVTALTAEVAAAVRSLGIENVSLLPNPVELRSPSCHGNTVLFAGEIGRRKGVDVLLEAWARVNAAQPDAELLLVGPLIEPDLIEVLPRGARFGGVLDRSEMLETVSHAYLAVLPSRAEAMPMFILEAMAGGVPVVATAVGSVEWLLEQGGIVVPVGDAEALGATIADLLADPARRDQLGRDAHRRVAEELSTTAFTRRVRALYSATFGD